MIIVKGGDDLRQELIAMQLMEKMQEYFNEDNLSLKLRTYEIIIISADSGIIEFVQNSISVDALKKKTNK